MAQMDMTDHGPSFAVAAARQSSDTEQMSLATVASSACHDGALLTSALADLALALF